MVTFDNVPIGCKFILNGTPYTKRSSRTARMNAYHGATFYVDQMARCKVISE